jgi:hypothetical protein
MAGGANPQMAANPYQQASGAQQAALATTQQGLGFTPMGITPESYQAGQIAGTNLSPYTNPYETQVVQQSMRDIGTQAQLGMNQLDAQAQQARAFGGSRHGVAMGEAMKGYTQQMADTATRMRQQGYNTALGLAGQDVAAQTAANQYAAGQRASAQSQNLAAQQAAMGTRLGAAQQMAGLGGQSFGYGQAIQQQQQQQGQQQRQMMQDLINAGKQQYAGYTGAPQQGLATFLGAMSGVPNLQGQQQGYNAGFLDYLMAAGQFA